LREMLEIQEGDFFDCNCKTPWEFIFDRLVVIEGRINEDKRVAKF